jgi:predicted MFS family arabinose efflux permease
MVPPLLPLVAGEWALPAAEAGLVNTVYAAGRLASAYPTSRFRARHGTRATVDAGLAVLVAGSLLAGLSPSFPAFLLGRALMGAGASAAFLAIFAELLEASPARWRGRAASAFEAASILSLAAGGLLAAVVAGAWGWRAAFVGTGPLLLLALLLRWGLDPAAGRQPSGAAAFRWRALTSPAVAPVLAAAFGLSATWSGLWTTLAPLLGAGAYGLDAAALGATLGAGYAAEVAGLAAVGLVIDRVRREPLFLAGTAAVVAGSAVLAAGARPAHFVLGLILVGAGFANWMIPATVLADRVGTPIPPEHLALYRVVMDVGMILGPLALGAVAQAAGARTAAAVSATALVLGSLALARR